MSGVMCDDNKLYVLLEKSLNKIIFEQKWNESLVDYVEEKKCV